MKKNEVTQEMLKELINCSGRRGGDSHFIQGRRRGLAEAIAMQFGFSPNTSMYFVLDEVVDLIERFADDESNADRLPWNPTSKAAQLADLAQVIREGVKHVRRVYAAQAARKAAERASYTVSS